jgi:hypothetical protein
MKKGVVKSVKQPLALSDAEYAAYGFLAFVDLSHLKKRPGVVIQ